ncbi:hypothetical protein CY34DRAFT_18631 [Suillus luteus UH-Slu-Lm8-n1]|uniref:Uncharacterized protein n=1 Tax=Suillus luteus UH-Slu-Lm8-n1 TaxID=930992 RepID=A0A0C9Z6F0_9AGAM|nr:hypothetical protein CY34DRAFT_18631 [Suillus luteus UH-Slu-Lm8-n1]
MSEDLPLTGHRPPQPRPFHSNPSNDASDPKFPDDGAEWLNNEQGLLSEFEKVDGSHFLLAGANAHIELHSPYLQDVLDEMPRNANPHVKASTTSSLVASLSLEALPDAKAWDAWPLTEDDDITTIYEFNGSTLETVGTPFKGHTRRVSGLALSFDNALLASASWDDTIKLWVFESRQLLASFHVQDVSRLVLSPDSRQLAYTTNIDDDHKICICDIPPQVLAQARNIARRKANLDHLLHSHATRPPAGHRKPPIHAIPTVQRPLPTRDSQQPVFIRLRQLLSFTSPTHAAHPVQPHNPLDVPATSPLPSSLSGQTATRFNHVEMSSPPPPSNGATQFLRQHISFLAPRHSLGPPVVEVAPGRKFTRLAAAKLPDYKKVDDTRHPSSQQGAVPQDNDTADVDSLPDVHWCKAFLCYCSCWSHGRLRMPPRWHLERIDIPRQDGAANGNSGGSQSRT